MLSQQERRVEGIKRIPVEALVEVCGLGEDGQAFEAESRDVSGRGIHLRTAYLPELGAPVVCRFDSGGQEVLAEGVIAWRKPQARGGEFGVRFTALNSKSAQILGQMCHTDSPPPVAPDAAVTAEPVPAPAMPAGTKVKLHIEGLSSPMRARVQQGSSEQLCVNSSLEFLRLGKRLHLEDVEGGQQSEAFIDGIDVVIDPNSGVPHLVVVLRSREHENTPEPSVMDTRNQPQPRGQMPAANQARIGDEASANGDPCETVSDDVVAMRSKLEESLSKVGLIVKITGTRAADIGKSLRDRGGPMMQHLVRSWSGGRRSRPQASQFKRRTAPPPSQLGVQANRNLRPQTVADARSDADVVRPPTSKKKMLIGAGAAFVVLSVVVAVGSRGAPTVASNSSNPQARAAAVLPASQSPNLSLLAPGLAAAPSGSALTAPVPLFGQTAMATLEPAPLAPPPSASATDGEAAREMAAAKAATAQVASGNDSASEDPNDKTEEPATKPEDVAPWGKGRMRDPIIYPVKLDGPGGSIEGHSFSKGFSVIIPKRKAMESPKGYEKRDQRFEKVSAANGETGVKLLWRFKDEVPGYRVRLRKNTVEFLISSKAE